jgi:hypothetical protein
MSAGCDGWEAAAREADELARQEQELGMGTAYEELWDPCEEGEPTKCHRCGEHGLTADGDGPCAKCGCYDDGCPEY